MVYITLSLLLLLYTPYDVIMTSAGVGRYLSVRVAITRAHVTGNYTSGVYVKYNIYKYDIITAFELYAYASLSKLKHIVYRPHHII